jgi:EryCIII-like glycosyltransferase
MAGSAASDMNIGVLPEHLPLGFRLCKNLVEMGHEVTVFDSHVEGIGRPGHVWSEPVGKYGLEGHERIHTDKSVRFSEWLKKEFGKERIDMFFMDALWQGLSFPLEGTVAHQAVYHAGFPDWRAQDCPTWCFVHPGHPDSEREGARQAIEQYESAGRGVRNLFRSQTGDPSRCRFDFGCTEPSNLPARRVLCLPLGTEFPGEAGRMACIGSLLPEAASATEIAGVDSRPAIIFVFGSSAFSSASEYEWLLKTAALEAQAYPDWQIVVAVWPSEWGPAIDQMKMGALPENMKVFGRFPLRDFLFDRRSPTVLVTTPGCGIFREAIAAGTPMVSIPRRMDQFAAAARVEFFGLGRALLSADLPDGQNVHAAISDAMNSTAIHERCAQMKEACGQFEASRPLERFLESLG